MKILHTSDWHLGRPLHRADLTPAFEMWVDHVVDTVREREVDALLISGDVYDRSVPPAPMVELFSRTLRRLAQLTTVILISGNHDSPQRLGFGAELFQERIVIRTDPLRCAQPVELRDRAGISERWSTPFPIWIPMWNGAAWRAVMLTPVRAIRMIRRVWSCWSARTPR